MKKGQKEIAGWNRKMPIALTVSIRMKIIIKKQTGGWMLEKKGIFVPGKRRERIKRKIKKSKRKSVGGWNMF